MIYIYGKSYTCRESRSSLSADTQGFLARKLAFFHSRQGFAETAVRPRKHARVRFSSYSRRTRSYFTDRPPIECFLGRVVPPARLFLSRADSPLAKPKPFDWQRKWPQFVEKPFHAAPRVLGARKEEIRRVSFPTIRRLPRFVFWRGILAIQSSDDLATLQRQMKRPRMQTRKKKQVRSDTPVTDQKFIERITIA